MKFKIWAEIPLVIGFLGSGLAMSVYSNLMIYRTCYTILNYNQSDCAKLGQSTDAATQALEKSVEPTATTINMVWTTTENVFSLIICLFVGAWSDRFGRRPVMIIATIGSTLMFSGQAIFSYFEQMSPWYLILFSIPMFLTGGPIFLTAIFSYITDVTPAEKRGQRIGVFEATLSFGILMGTTAGSYILKATNYTTIFGIAVLTHVISLAYLVFCVPESVKNTEEKEKMKGFFDMSSVFGMLKGCVKKRRGYDRAMLLLTAAVLIINTLAFFGEISVMFYFVRAKFAWTLVKYNWFSSIGTIISVCGTILGSSLLHKTFKVPETTLMLVGMVTSTASMLIYGFAVKDFQVYLGSVMRALLGVVSPMARSFISRLVQGDEIGKLFSLISVACSTLNLLSSPLYTAIYNTTLNKDPAIFNFATASFYTLTTSLIVVIIFLERRNPPSNDGEKNGNLEKKRQSRIECESHIAEDVLETLETNTNISAYI